MDITKYISSLGKLISNDDITSEKEYIASSVRNEVSVMISSLVEAEKLKPEHTKLSKYLTRELLKALPSPTKRTLGESLHVVNQRVMKNVDWLIKDQDVGLFKTFLSRGATVKEVVALANIDMTTYYIDYISNLTSILIRSYASTMTQRDIYEVSKVEDIETSKYIRLFGSTVSHLSMDHDVFVEMLTTQPELVVTGKNEKMVKSVNPQTDDTIIDQMPSGFIGNPIFHARMIVADYYAWRYKGLMTKKNHVEQLLLSFKNELNETHNPTLEKEVEYTEERLGRIEDKLADIRGY